MGNLSMSVKQSMPKSRHRATRRVGRFVAALTGAVAVLGTGKTADIQAGAPAPRGEPA